MSKLYFRYGAMGASKTANLLMTDFNFKEKGMNTLIMKSILDTRDGFGITKSRIGIKAESLAFAEDDNLFDMVGSINMNAKLSCILCDECQFLTETQVDQLSNVVDLLNIPVMCFGLRTDFMGELFPGSKRLLAIADSIEEIKTVCYCGAKAIMNVRIINGKPVFDGEQVVIGGNESYKSFCRKHYKKLMEHYYAERMMKKRNTIIVDEYKS